METRSNKEPTTLEVVVQNLPLVVVLLLGLVNLARGGFHWLSPDSGAGSVAGMSLAYPDAANIIFLLSLSGVSQIFFGLWYVYFALWQKELVPLALGTETALSALVLLTEYLLKPPVAPVPGRFAHMATLIVSLAALIVYFIYSRQTRQRI